MRKITTGATIHDKNEVDAVNKVLSSSTQMGENTYRFENSVAKLFSKKYGVGVNSGSSALFLAGQVLSEYYPSKKKLITPVLTFSTTVSSIIQAGFIPSFIDVELDTFNIDISKIEKAIDKDTIGLWIPNLIGNFSNLQYLRDLADKHKLFYLEDSADSLGGKFMNKSTGSYADYSTTSFYGSHVINCAGNGGMFCLNDDKMYDLARILRSWGRSSSVFDKYESESIEKRFDYKIDGIECDRKFVFEKIGYNLEPSEIGFAYGNEQLKKLDKNIEIRRRNFKFYNENLNQITDQLITPREIEGVYTGWLSYPLTIKPNKNFNRKDIMIYLEKNNIQTRTVFTGNILRQPGFKNINHSSYYNSFENADNIMKNSFLIGLHHGLSEEDTDYVIEIFKNFFNQF